MRACTGNGWSACCKASTAPVLPLPLTGVPLPFVAYGGSSLIANFVIIGLLLRLSQRNA